MSKQKIQKGNNTKNSDVHIQTPMYVNCNSVEIIMAFNLRTHVNLKEMMDMLFVCSVRIFETIQVIIVEMSNRDEEIYKESRKSRGWLCLNIKKERSLRGYTRLET